MNPKTFAHLGAAACIGVVAWRGIPALIALSAIIPPLIFSQRSRVEAFLMAFAYYAAASRPLIPGTLGYFGPSGTVFHAFLFWAVPSLLLPLPWTVCWTAAASNGLDAMELMWERTLDLDQARLSKKTLLIGVGLPIVGASNSRNAVLVIRNSVPTPVLERIPVPLIMWNPIRGRGLSAPLRLFDSGIIDIDGERAALLVCYEQLLTWPILESAVQHPTLIVGLANDNWAKGTPIPAAQQAVIAAWARLFRLPKILAVNS